MLDIYEGIIFDVAIPKQDVHEKIKEMIAKMQDILGCEVHVSLREAHWGREECIGVKNDDFFLEFFTSGSEYNENWTEEQAENAALCMKEIVGQSVKYTMTRYQNCGNRYPKCVV